MPERWTTDAPDAHLAAEDVDLDLAERDHGHQGQAHPRGAAGDDDRAGEQLLGREGHREDVVDPEVERPELRLEVAAARQPEGRRHPLGELVRAPQPPQQRRAVIVVHVDDGEVRMPVGQQGVRLGQGAGRPDDEQAMVEGQLDEVHDQRAIVEHEGAVGFTCLRFHAMHRRVHRELPP